MTAEAPPPPTGDEAWALVVAFAERVRDWHAGGPDRPRWSDLRRAELAAEAAVKATPPSPGSVVLTADHARAVAALIAAGDDLDAGSGRGAGTATERIAALRRLYAGGYRSPNDDFRVSEEAMGAFCAALADPSLTALRRTLAGAGEGDDDDA